jgi:putative Mn2+ efflux pump MntP
MFNLLKTIVSICIFVISLAFAGILFGIGIDISFDGNIPYIFTVVLGLLSLLSPIFGIVFAVKFYKNTKQSLGFVSKFIIVPVGVTLIITTVALTLMVLN